MQLYEVLMAQQGRAVAVPEDAINAGPEGIRRALRVRAGKLSAAARLLGPSDWWAFVPAQAGGEQDRHGSPAGDRRCPTGWPFAARSQAPRGPRTRKQHRARAGGGPGARPRAPAGI